MRRLLAMFLVVVMLAGSHAGLAPSARADDAPSAVMAGDRLTVFARASNGKLAHRWYDGTKGSWTEWAEISGTEITSAPSAAMGPPEGRLHGLRSRYQWQAFGDVSRRRRWEVGGLANARHQRDQFITLCGAYGRRFMGHCARGEWQVDGTAP